MPKPPSLILDLKITRAGKSHSCRFNKAHRISKDHRRLTVRLGGTTRNYCLACASNFLAKELERLHTLIAELSQAAS